MLSTPALNNAKVKNFYNNADAANIGQVYKINNFMQQQNYNAAQSLNNSFAPQNLMEQNRKIVNGVYLNRWANGNYAFTSADSAILLNIAIQNPVLSGNAVYTARVMLGIDCNSATPSSSRMANASTINDNKTEPVVGLVYPNPVTNNANIDYTINSANAELRIYSVTGKEMAVYQLNTNENHFTFSTNEFNNGVYIYQIISNNEVISYNKFIIIK